MNKSEEFAIEAGAEKSYILNQEQLEALVINVAYSERQRIIKIIADLIGKNANLYDVLDSIG